MNIPRKKNICQDSILSLIEKLSSTYKPVFVKSLIAISYYDEQNLQRLTGSKWITRQDNPEHLEHESLQEENRRQCYDDGFEDGENNNPFNKDRDSGCSEYGNSYESGFSAGCQSVEGNTNDSCKLAIEGHDIYCPDNPDDPACTEFLHDVSNKQPLPPKSGSVCDGPYYHPGCPQIVNPERYCLVTDDPAFCKAIGDICDADGFVKPEDAYCTK